MNNRLNPLLEIAPGDLIQSARGVGQHLSNAYNSLKNSINIVRKDKSNIPLRRKIAKVYGRTIRDDPTLAGDAARVMETGRNAATAFTLHNLEPLPVADQQSIQNLGRSALVTLKRGNSKHAPGMAANAIRAIATSAKDNAENLLARRATASTLSGSDILSFSGGIAKLLGKTNAPIIANPMKPVMQGLGVSDKDLLDYTKQGYRYYAGGLRQLGKKAKSKLYSFIHRRSPKNVEVLNTTPAIA